MNVTLFRAGEGRREFFPALRRSSKITRKSRDSLSLSAVIQELSFSQLLSPELQSAVATKTVTAALAMTWMHIVSNVFVTDAPPRLDVGAKI